MLKKSGRLLIFLLLLTCKLVAQQVLPDITVKNLGNQVIISWRNEYTKPVSYILIQRSFDSLRNYNTLISGSVLDPKNPINGHVDADPPYSKMYYRVMIGFDGGTFIYGRPVRPVKEKISFNIRDTAVVMPEDLPVEPDSFPQNPNNITYPSHRVFTGKDNNVIIYLPDAWKKKYMLKVFNEKDEMIFEINRVTENYLIIEKMNFIRSGWYHFELFNNGKLMEKNKFFVPRD